MASFGLHKRGTSGDGWWKNGQREELQRSQGVAAHEITISGAEIACTKVKKKG